MSISLSAPVSALPSDAYRATIAAQDVPARMTSRSRSTLDVDVRNDSRLHWLATARSGLTVAGRWTDADGDLIADIQPSGDLPDLAPQAAVSVKLDVVVPGEPGDYRLHVDLCDEGSRWFHRDPRHAFTVPVVVEPSAPPQRSRVLNAARRVFGRTERYSFALGAGTRQMLAFGWSVPENWGTWSNGPIAKLRLPGQGKYGRWRVEVVFNVFGRDGEQKPVGVRIGYSGPELDWHIATNTVVQQQVDVGFVGEDVTLRFSMPGAISPMELNKVLDLRRLGIGLVEMRMTPAGL
jgi:hypothetical protein